MMMGIMACAAQPAWFFAQAPTSNDIYGRGAAKTKDKYDAEAKETARQEALADISKQIYVQVNAYIQTKDTETGNNASSSFLKEIQVESCVNVCNATTVKDGIDNKVYYIVISVSRERLINHYLNMVNRTADEAIAAYDVIMDLLNSKNDKDALSALQQLRGKLIDLENFTNIFSALYSGSLTDAVPQLSKRPRMGDVDARIAVLRGNPRQSYDDLAEDIISQLPPQLCEPRAYLLSYIEWLNTGFSSDFSGAFSEHLAGVLERRFNWYKVSGSQKPEITLGGQLLPEGDRINILIRISGAYNHTCTTQLSPNSLAHLGMDFVRPKDLEEKLKSQKTFVDDKVQKGQLSVRIKFPKYDNTPAVYRLGEEINLFIKANKPCYVTVINVEANGAWNILEENHRVNADSVGEWLTLFETYLVSPPIGVEQLLVQASLDPLPVYKTRTENVPGGTKAISEGLATELAQTRGLVKKTPESNEYTEFYLTWTVLEK